MRPELDEMHRRTSRAQKSIVEYLSIMGPKEDLLNGVSNPDIPAGVDAAGLALRGLRLLEELPRIHLLPPERPLIVLAPLPHFGL